MSHFHSQCAGDKLMMQALESQLFCIFRIPDRKIDAAGSHNAKRDSCTVNLIERHPVTYSVFISFKDGSAVL